MASSLSVKLGVIDREFSEGLERNSRRFKVFGREIDEISRTVGGSLGESTRSLGKLGEGFKIAGAAAGIFSGADGLLGIGASLASGGLVLGGMAAFSFWLNTIEKDAEEAKKKLESFKDSIDIFAKTPNLAAANQRTLQAQFDILAARKKALEGRYGSLIQKDDAISNALGLNKFVGYVTGISALEGQMKLIAQEMYEIGKFSVENAPKYAADELAKYQQRAEKLTSILDAMNKSALLGAPREAFLSSYLNAWSEVNDLVREHGREIGKVGDITRQLATNFANTPMLDLRGVQAAAAGAMATFNGALNPSNVRQTPSTPLATLNQVQIGNFVAPMVRIADLSKDSINHIDRVAGAINAGFYELPEALAGVLGPIILGAFGNSRGAQIGGGLGSAFGTGVGGYILKAAGASAGLGTLLGAAFLPIVGGVLGGAIGSLFGGHKHAIDNNTSAINANTAALEKLTNVPAGYKVDKTAYNVQQPVIMMNGREVARVVMAEFRRESQAQFGTSMRIAEIAL